MACFELPETVALLDLTDPRTLVQYDVNPLEVATKDRRVSQRLAARIYDQGAPGFLWWSSLEPTWTNASLFAGRTLAQLSLCGPVVPLSLDIPDVVEAAKQTGVFLKHSH